MDTLVSIQNRRSISLLIEPAPDGADLQTMLTAAVMAPDHGRCRPWRFIVLQGADKDAFGLVLEKAYFNQCREVSTRVNEAKQRRELTKLKQAPLVIVTACVPRHREAIPLHEQQAAVAAATQNLLLAATALGYGSMWRTGRAATDPIVKASLGLSCDDTIIAFVYLGTIPEGRPAASPRNVRLEDAVMFWSAAKLSPQMSTMANSFSQSVLDLSHVNSGG
jgi:nitroreductase